MTKKLTATQEAIQLLQRQGYEVTKPQPEVRIGDVYEINDVPVLITLYDGTDYANSGEQGSFKWGGFQLQDKYTMLSHRNLRYMWMEESARLRGEYKLLGHVDLSEWIK